MSYAKAWLKWFEVIEAGAAPLSARMIAYADLRNARLVLDIGTGIGEPGISAAKALSRYGHVQAVDHDQNMIAIAEQRSKAQNVKNICFSVTAIEEMSFDKHSFDAVLARWSLMFVEDLDSLLAKLHTGIAPGGGLIAATWATASDVPALNLARKAVRNHFGLPHKVTETNKTFSLSDISATEQRFTRAGFSQITTELVPVIYEFSSPKEYIQYRIDVAGPLWEGMNEETVQKRQAVFDKIGTDLEAYRVSENTYRMQNIAHCIVARK